jgi:putative flippase GtrA
MAAERIGGDAVRFLIAGGINTALSTALYFAARLVLPYGPSYALAWLAGLFLATVFYPDHVFPGGRTGFRDRFLMGVSIIVVFLVGLASLHLLHGLVRSDAIAFFATLVITTILNFSLSRWILRRPR